MQIDNLKTRSLVIQHTRNFFISRDYLEVDTPIRCPSIIPEAHIDPMGSENQYLQASPELCMKRILSKGIPKIFQICKCFRKGERGRRHLPELTLLEWYAKHQTYRDLMDQCQDLIRDISANLGMGNSLDYQGRTIDLSMDFDCLTIEKAFEIYAGISADHALETNRFDEIISFKIEPFLGMKRPCFLIDYPACQASLAKLKPDSPNLAQRFELYISGIELANGFTELTDPLIQAQRFKQENEIRQKSGASTLPLPEKFLADLGGMPEAAGIALGIDRLVMLFCNAENIDQVVAFTPEDL